MSRKTTTRARGRAMLAFTVRATVAALLCLPGAIPAFADDSVQHQFTIPAQSLPAALEEFARQSGIEIVLSPQVATGYSASVLYGRYTSARALEVLLAGTGLTARPLNDKTIEVQAGSAQFVRTAGVQAQL